MTANISADTFRPSKRFSAVVVGQGEALLDSAVNEDGEIVRHRMDVTGRDEIGGAGVPKDAGGFEVTVAPDGLDLFLSPGRIYVDGSLCVNEPQPVDAVVGSPSAVKVAIAAPDGMPFAAGQWLDVTGGGAAQRMKLKTAAGRDLDFTQAVPGMPAAGSHVTVQRVTSLRGQPDRFTFDPFDPMSTEHVVAGSYRVELDVWHRHISPVEDPSIREPALGEAESSTRMKVVWQVRLVSAGPIGGGACAPAAPAAPGLLRASTVPGLPTDDACLLPDEAGYRGLENQLYRVEVHTSSASEVVLKWQRDNASMASRLTAVGTTLVVEDMGRDDERGFVQATLVDVTDDALELEHRAGDLLDVLDTDKAQGQIMVATASTKASLARGARARRWDGRIVIDPMSPTAGQPVLLERGLQVALEPGRLRSGDFWLIPARSATSAGGGALVLPADDDGTPLPQPPRGVQHHVASLALVDTDGQRFLGRPANVRECRRPFPPLTAIEASDVGLDDAIAQLGADDVQEAIDALAQRSAGSRCSLLIGPGEDLATAIARLDGVQDALICLRVGAYQLNVPLVIDNRRHIELVGSGPGTEVVAAQSETALRFSRCQSVKVTDLSLESRAVGAKGLNGTLSFVDCPSVTVEDVRLQCAGGPVRAGACVSARNSAAAPGSRLHVHGCELSVGHLQTGILAVDVDLVDVADNLLLAGARPATDILIADRDYQSRLRQQLIWNMTRVPGGRTNATVSYDGWVLHLNTPPELVPAGGANSDWQRAIDRLAPAGIGSIAALKRYLLGLAGDAIRTRGTGVAGSPRMVAAVNRVLAADRPVIGQGIVVTGKRAVDARVTGNVVRDALQGVHIGVSDDANRAAAAGSVAIESNLIQILLAATARRERHGIFVGHADSVVVERNQIRLARVGGIDIPPTHAISVFGRMGMSTIVRHNHAHDGFATGVTWAPLTQPLPDRPMWIVTENVMEGAAIKVSIPVAYGGQPGVLNPTAVTQRTRGLADNFA
jgi:hypothetical protein